MWSKVRWLVLILLFPVAAWAEDFRISDIRIEGLQKVSAGSIFAVMPVNVGDTISASSLQELSRAIFKLGYFDDVQVGQDGGVLVITLKERPTIAELKITGNKSAKTEDLTDGLKKAGLSEGQIFKRSTLDGVAQELERQYVSQGRYSADVKTEVRDLPLNRVALDINIDEGEMAAIKSINIVGNKAFPTEELLRLFTQETTNWLSWINNDDKYSKEKMTGDLERLKSFYMDRGYLDFNIESSQISMSPDKETIFITVSITEGEIYTVSAVDLSGKLVAREEEIRRLILVKENTTYSQDRVTRSAEYITQRLGNEGYSFAEVKGVPERDINNHTVKVTFVVVPGQRAYVRRIEFKGNTRTADDVLRREMRQMEGAAASTSKIEQSKTRLDRLGYFKEIEVETVEVPGTADMVDVNYTVEEQPSGSIGASVGFAQGSGVILGANVQQTNFLGTGKQIGANFSTSSYQTTMNFNYLDPYYTPDGVSRGFDVFYTTRDLDEVNVSNYSVDSFGANINFGYPMSEISSVNFSFGYVNSEITVGSDVPQQLQGSPLTYYSDYVSQSDINTYCTAVGVCNPLPTGSFGTAPWTVGMLTAAPQGFLDIYGNSFDDFKVSASWRQSTLNKGRFATRGQSQQLMGEMTVPGSSLEWWKASYTKNYFTPISENLTLHLRGRFGVGDGYGNVNGLPFYENYFAGGLGSVRGIKKNTLGPQTTAGVAYTAIPVNWSGVGALTNAHILCDAANSFANPLGCKGNTGKLATAQLDNGEDPFGGNVVMTGSVEILFPTPFVKDQRSMQTMFFMDVGNVYDTNCDLGQANCNNFSPGDLAIGVGVGLNWITSFGPLTFSLGFPVSKAEGDSEIFQFSLGQNF